MYVLFAAMPIFLFDLADMLACVALGASNSNAHRFISKLVGRLKSL